MKVYRLVKFSASSAYTDVNLVTIDLIYIHSLIGNDIRDSGIVALSTTLKKMIHLRKL